MLKSTKLDITEFECSEGRVQASMLKPTARGSKMARKSTRADGSSLVPKFH